MLHEEASHEVVLVTDALGVIGVPEEKQPRITDSARCQYGQPRLDRQRSVTSDEGANTGDAAWDLAVGEQLCDVRSEDDSHVRGGG